MSKTFTYILIVIMVYLLVIFPKMVSKSETETTEQKEETDSNGGSAGTGILNGVASDFVRVSYTM